MKYSELFGKTQRAAPRQEVSINARLLEQGGFIHKMMAGAYAYLPLGLRVLNKIETIIRSELDALGAQEMYLPALQSKELWSQTGRWESLAQIMYQFSDHSGRDIGLATTHEEPITQIFASHVVSYRDLPVALYQIQDKFRDEPRAKSGLIRGREFSMKDLYSFHESQDDCDKFYNRVAEAYQRIFDRVGCHTLMIEASGGDFTSSRSHEFQVLSEAGEDRLIYCANNDFAQNKEITSQKPGAPCPSCGKPLEEGKGIEVGNIFKLGTRFSESLGAAFITRDGKSMPIVMASYGIGPGRLMGAVVEVSHDDHGIRWPTSIAPFDVHIVCVQRDAEVLSSASRLEQEVARSGFSSLTDDRDVSAGVKFADADLIGIPFRVVLSTKLGSKLEVRNRQTEEVQVIERAAQLIKALQPT